MYTQQKGSAVSYESELSLESSLNYDKLPVVKVMLIQDVLFHSATIALGSISVAGGFVITMGTGGLAAIGGGALIGAGLESFSNGVKGTLMYSFILNYKNIIFF
jgi:hypothetical protein